MLSNDNSLPNYIFTHSFTKLKVFLHHYNLCILCFLSGRYCVDGLSESFAPMSLKMCEPAYWQELKPLNMETIHK